MEEDKITFEEAYYEGGQLWYKWQYLNGIKHGEQLGYYSDGRISYKFYYINDNKVSYGEWVKYNRNLKLNSIWENIK